jgi:probable F420-dependent oxidoreductase
LAEEIAMKWVMSLAFTDPAQYVPLARAAEAAGFEAIALSDHVVHPEKILTPYPYTPDGAPRWQPFTAWPDPWVTAAHLAAATTRLRFVTSIYVLPMRNPLLAAKQIGTAAVLSGGRIALGVGAGWMKDEFDVTGAPFERRGARLDESIEILRKLWAGGWVEHQGEFFSFPRLEMSPVPPAPIPIWSGGISKPALRRAARVCDGWISDMHTTAELQRIVTELRALRADSPRAREPFAVLGTAVDAFDRAGYRRLAEIGVTHVQTMPWYFYGGPTDVLERRIDGIRRFGEDVIQRS